MGGVETHCEELFPRLVDRGYDITIIRHTNGRLLVADGAFCKNMPKTGVYEGTGEVEWRDMTYSGFSEGDDCPGAMRYSRRSGKDQQALHLAD